MRRDWAGERWLGWKFTGFGGNRRQMVNSYTYPISRCYELGGTTAGLKDNRGPVRS